MACSGIGRIARGSSVGFVANKPVLASSLGAVRATVMIDAKIKIPKGSSFKVDSSGLLGDKFVAVQTMPDFDPAKFNPNDPSQVYQPGDVIQGENKPDITEIATEASRKLTAALDSFQGIVNNLKNGVLSPASQKNLEDTFVSLKVTGQNWADASGKLPGIATNAQNAVDKANETMTTAKDAAEDLRKMLDKASQGGGLVAQLINNRQLADNFNALVVNLREHGILFYKNAATPTPSPSPEGDKKKR